MELRWPYCCSGHAWKESLGGLTTHSYASLCAIVRHLEIYPAQLDAVLALQVVSALAGQFMAQQVRNGIQRLVDEGHVYTTCDEFHFKIAAG